MGSLALSVAPQRAAPTAADLLRARVYAVGMGLGVCVAGGYGGRVSRRRHDTPRSIGDR